MRDVRDMEAEAKRIAALSPEERAVEAEKLHAHRVSLGLEESAAVKDILTERARQVIDEGWTAAQDDEHTEGELAQAAACYADPAPAKYGDPRVPAPARWPRNWAWNWWKPKDRRRNLVRAAALIIAEIERLDRAALSGAPRQ